MNVTLDLSEDSLSRLEAEAARSGVSIEIAIDESVSMLPADNPPQRTRGLIGLGGSTSTRRASKADEMLADRFGQA